MRRIIAALSASLLLGASGLAGPACAQQQQDAITDPVLKGQEVIAFIGIKPGDQVADIFAGRFVRALSAAVGPKGKLYAVEPIELIKAHPEIMQPGYANVSVITAPANAPGLPASLDAVFIRQDYHDLHDAFMGPADVAAFNRAVFAALKPGGVYVVLDHAAQAGSGLRDTNTLHRIDPAAVKAEVTAAGFKLDAESTILANATDDHSKMVFDPAIRGNTDQFLMRFLKPR